MGKISQKKRIEGYCKVAGQLCENPFMYVEKIAKNAELGQNTASKYMKSMYTKNILIGPWISLNPHSNYKEYVYLMDFSDPPHIYEGLKGFPHVLYHGIALGDWNTIVITDRLLDFSQLVGFESMVYQGVKGHVYTPKVEFTTWDQSLKKMYEQIEWMKTLHHHCTIHTEFYPEGSKTYMNYCFLLSSDYNQSIISLFFWPPQHPLLWKWVITC